MWNIELDRHRDIMRAEAEAQVLRQKQEFEARYPKKQAGTLFSQNNLSKFQKKADTRQCLIVTE